MAARLEALAEPGGIRIADVVFKNVKGKLDLDFAELAAKKLKNIADPVTSYRVLLGPAGDAQERRPLRRHARFVRLAAALAVLVALGATGWWWLAPTPIPDKLAGDKAASASKPGAVPPRTVARTSIVVLPFVNQSGDASQEYFSDGLTEDLIAALGRFSSLAVIARNSAFSYKGKVVKPADVARDLGVRYIVEGSVRRSGSRIRVSAQLSDAKSGKLLWSHKYDDLLKDVFAVQDSITRQVAGALAINLGRIEQKRAASLSTDKLDAYDLVLRGRGLMRRVTRAANCKARTLFERAIRIDPRYAAAYAALGRAYRDVAEFGWSEDMNAVLDRALERAQTALRLDPDNVEGFNIVAAVRAVRGQYLLALAASDRALAINPSNAVSMRERAGVLLWLGRIDEAISAGETALRFDPNPTAGAIVVISIAYYEAKRHTDAVRLVERGVLRFPNHPLLYAVLAASYGQMGKKEEAARALAKLRRLSPFFDAASFGSRFRNRDYQAYLADGLAKAGAK